MRKTYSFDDVLLVPKYSDIESREHVDLSSALGPKINLKLPIISSPMDTVTGRNMALMMHLNGGLGVVHRYNKIEEQAEIIKSVKAELPPANIGAAIGMTRNYMTRAKAVHEAGAKVLCVDVAHGHHSMMETCIKSLKDAFAEDVHLMVGNVATLKAFEALGKWGADSIRVGIGGGSICSTRIITGHGVPTLQSVFDIAKTSSDVKIIADGGIKTIGDMVKALAAGADFVMLGSVLAGSDETPGDIMQDKNGRRFKHYRGMASAAAQRAWRGRNPSSTPEGVATTVMCKGPVNILLKTIAGGIKSGLSYSGARNLEELRSKAEFIIQSGASQIESSTHILRSGR